MTFIIGQPYQFVSDGTQFVVLKIDPKDTARIEVKYLNAPTKVGARWINPHKNTQIVCVQ